MNLCFHIVPKRIQARASNRATRTLMQFLELFPLVIANLRKKIVQIITKCQVYINYLDDLPDLVRFGNRLSKMAGGCVAYDGGSSSRPLNNAFKKC